MVILNFIITSMSLEGRKTGRTTMEYVARCSEAVTGGLKLSQTKLLFDKAHMVQNKFANAPPASEATVIWGAFRHL